MVKPAVLNCGQCTACCQWGQDDTLRVRLTEKDILMGHTGVALPNGEVVIATDGRGNCMNLDLKEHKCKVHDHAPEKCKQFDCRDVLAEVAKSGYPLTNVLVAAVYLNKTQMVESAVMRTAGFVYQEACVALDNGEDFRKIEVPELVERIKKELKLG